MNKEIIINTLINFGFSKYKINGRIIIIFIVYLCVLAVNLVSCGTTQVPVPIKVHPLIIACPDIPSATESSILYAIVDLRKNYELCKTQTNGLINFYKE